MFNKLIDFGASLCDSYTAWIICSILFFAYLMGTEYKKVYSFHLEMRSSPSKNGKESTILTMKPFSREESICMVRKFLDNIQYGTAFSDTEIQNLIGEGGDQRQIMNYTIQALAEKIAEEKIYE